MAQMTDAELIRKLSETLWAVYHNYCDMCIRLAQERGLSVDSYVDVMPAEHKEANRKLMFLQTYVTNPHHRDKLQERT